MGTDKATEEENHVGEEKEEPSTTKSAEHDETDGCSSPIYENNFDGHLPLHWLEPKDNTTKSQIQPILPSFKDLQLKTHRTLYGTTNSTIVPTRDKSPKGSVDAPIRHLVDLINSHSRFCTLSSCSGRISLFDPNGSSQDYNKSNNFTEESGKGRGNWVLVSHYQLAPEVLVHTMKSDKHMSFETFLSPWTFRFEPMLLHIAAASLEDGRRLLTIALNLGFRESGLVVTDKRVTVAIRSHSLSTATPLFPSNVETAKENSESNLSACWRVPDFYLRALVQDANQRLEANWKHLDKLYSSIETSLFDIRSSPPPLVVRNGSNHASLSALNLWNTVGIGPIPKMASSQEEECKQEVWIFGGYGCGPIGSNRQASPKRSSNLLKLQKSEGSWSGWKTLGSVSPFSSSFNHQGRHDEVSTDMKISSGTLERYRNSILRIRWCEEMVFPDLQGMASCRWRGSMYLLWGGRKSPQAPSDALFLIDTSKNARIGSVLDVRGDLPPPRWGHKFLPLSEDRAALLGGCNQQEGALDDIFILHFLLEDDDNNNATARGYFYWERLSIRLPTPRFHFGAVILKRDTILLLGGLESTREVLRSFESDNESTSSSAVWACKIGASKRNSGETTTIPSTYAAVIKVETFGSKASFESCFGMACCTLLSKNLLLVTGGVRPNVSSGEALQAYWLSSCDSSTLSLRRIALDYDPYIGDSADEFSFDFGSLVHHCCLPLTDSEVLLVGGGVPSFAFGEAYARSYHLMIDSDNSCAQKKRIPSKNSFHGKLGSSPTAPMKAPNGTNHGGEAKETANVLYVSPKHARRVKNDLQQKGWLEKRYRMIKVEHKEIQSDDESNPDPVQKQMIAIPVSVQFSEAIAVFGEIILSYGEEELPLSTSQYASKSKETR